MPNPSLRKVQRLFWRSVADCPGQGSFDRHLIGTVNGADLAEQRARIGVYADAYWMRLRGVLLEDFPRTAQILGGDTFALLIKEYLQEFPSEDPSVRYVGRALAEFVANRNDLPPFLADLVRLEWARADVFDAQEAGSVTIRDLVSVSPEAWPMLRFRTITALRVIQVNHPVHELWAATEAPFVAAMRTSIRVWRAQDYRIFHAPMDDRENLAIGQMIADKPFARICDAFADLPDSDAAREATALLARWIEDGIISEVVAVP